VWRFFVLGLPPGSQPPGTQARARILFADAPLCAGCHFHPFGE
jgi:hypothetical protein